MVLVCVVVVWLDESRVKWSDKVMRMRMNE